MPRMGALIRCFQAKMLASSRCPDGNAFGESPDGGYRAVKQISRDKNISAKFETRCALATWTTWGTS